MLKSNLILVIVMILAMAGCTNRRTANQLPPPREEVQLEPIDSHAAEDEEVSALGLKKHGQKVAHAQIRLNREGATLKVDGAMGPQTVKALKDYQKTHGLKPTGNLDKATSKKLGL